MEIRLLEPGEYIDAIALSDQTFRDQDHISMGYAFPQVFSSALKQAYGAFDGDRLVSFMGLVPASIRVGYVKLNVFSIGSVCTHPHYRKQGISSKILERVIKHIDKAGASLLFVSGDRNLYRRANCFRFGLNHQYQIDTSTEMITSFDGFVRDSLPTDIFQIEELAHLKTIRYDSNIWEMYQLFQSGGYASIFKMEQRLLVAEQNGRIKAFAIVGIPNKKSKETKSILIDWAGDSVAAVAIFKELVRMGTSQKIEITIPWHDPLVHALHNHSNKQMKSSGTIHIVKPERLIQQIYPYLLEKNQLLAEKLKVETDENRNVQICLDEHTCSFDSEKLVELLFSPQTDSKYSAFSTIFPIPLPHTDGIHYV